jgi:hypothetical protein
VGVEKVQFPPKQPKFRGYKMPRKLGKSFVGLPNAKAFRKIGDFAHPFDHFPASEGSIPLAAKAASLNNDGGVSSVSQD